MKIDVMVYPVGHIRKPSAEEQRKILPNMIKERIEVCDAVKLIKRGYVFCPGILENGISQENWVSQQLFGVDVDNENYAEKHSVRDNIKLCEQLHFVPISIYGSFSYTYSNQKHHMLFLLDRPITDQNLQIRIQGTLNRIFGGDPGTLSANHCFNGGPVNFFPNYYPSERHLIHPDSALFASYEPIRIG